MLFSSVHLIKSDFPTPSGLAQINSHLHIVFEDVGSSWHVHNVIDNELAESRQQISPLVQRLNLVGFILLVSLYRQKKTSNYFF